MNENSENIGFLIVDVRTANGALPVEGAKVYVYPYNENAQNSSEEQWNGGVIYSLTTDESGKMPKVALETKPKDLSLESGNIKPFMTYNIAVYADGFYDSENINVPIFSGVTSIQTENLIPLAEYSSPDSYNPDYQSRYVETPDTQL